MELVIVDSNFNKVKVYRATIDNAKKILSHYIHLINPQVFKLVENEKKVLNKQSMVQILNGILSKPEGLMASKSIQANKQNKQELIAYCFKNKINIDNNKINEDKFFKHFKINDLSFFDYNERYDEEAEIVDEYVIEQARKYSIIKEDNWREGAKEISKVHYILNFAQELAQKNIKIEVMEVKEVI